MADIMVYGLTQNNLKHVTFRIPKEKIGYSDFMVEKGL